MENYIGGNLMSAKLEKMLKWKKNAKWIEK
jgi:hypothetical protein